jgi:hypothetical protein
MNDRTEAKLGLVQGVSGSTRAQDLSNAAKFLVLSVINRIFAFVIRPCRMTDLASENVSAYLL